MVSRRQMLVTGGASLLLIGGGISGFALTRSSAKAREPWTRAGQSFGDPRLDALAYALLAPNPHNRQPWQVRLEGRDSFALFCNLDKRLPHTDPPNRQITIGFGTFLELFRQAAAEKGFRADITPFPEGEPHPVLDERPIARVTLVVDPGVVADPLFETVLERRSTKEPFDSRPVEPESFARLYDMAMGEHTDERVSLKTSSEADRAATFRDLTWKAWEVEYFTPRTQQESVDLMRIGAAEINTNPDGIDLDGPMMEAMYLGGIISREQLAEKGSTAYNTGISMYKEMLANTHSFGWLSSTGNSRAEQLATGKAWVRINQAAAVLGIAMHPVSQILQEFPEMEKLYDALHEHVEVPAPARVQGLFRFGYAERPSPSPRWPLESLIIDV